MAAASQSNVLVNRMIGAMKLDPHVFEDVEHDQGAMSQALLVVAIAAAAGGVGAAIANVVSGSPGAAAGGLIYGIISGIIGWLVWSVVIYLVGSTLFKLDTTHVDLGQVLRTLGFAQAPLVFGVFTFLPLLGDLLAFALLIWVLVATVVAIRAAFDFDTGRAVGTAVVGFIAVLIVSFLLAVLLAPIIGAGALAT